MVNTKQKDEIEFAAFMGIDWADQTHAWALALPTHCGVEHGDLAHTPEALEAWAAELAWIEPNAAAAANRARHV